MGELGSTVDGRKTEREREGERRKEKEKAGAPHRSGTEKKEAVMTQRNAATEKRHLSTDTQKHTQKHARTYKRA